MKYPVTIISLVILLIATVSILVSNTDFVENKVLNPQQIPSYKIPDWVKHNADWWANDHITDSEFSYSIQYLIDEGIIHECVGDCN